MSIQIELLIVSSLARESEAPTTHLILVSFLLFLRNVFNLAAFFDPEPYKRPM